MVECCPVAELLIFQKATKMISRMYEFQFPNGPTNPSKSVLVKVQIWDVFGSQLYCLKNFIWPGIYVKYLGIKFELQWGSKYWTGLVLKWSEVVR